MVIVSRTLMIQLSYPAMPTNINVPCREHLCSQQGTFFSVRGFWSFPELLIASFVTYQNSIIILFFFKISPYIVGSGLFIAMFISIYITPLL